MAAPALALLHETIPHAGLHHALGRAADDQRRRPRGLTRGHGVQAAPRADLRRRAGVDHRANGFDPTEILRDFDYGKTRRLASGRVLREWELVAGDKEIEVAPGRQVRRPGPTTAASRARRCAAREGERLRVRFGNGSEHPHTIHFHGIHPAAMDGVPGRRARGLDRARRAAHATSSRPSRSACTSTTATSTPLAEHIARGLYGAFIIDPQAGPPRGRRAGDGDERLRHELRPRERGLRRQHGRLRTT